MFKNFIKGGYVFVAFISAFLLFWIQPVIARYFTPILGGSPMVWNTLLFFFQFFLLIGYAYANYLSAWFSRKHSLIVHVVFIGLTILFLPIDLQKTDVNPSGSLPVIWLIINAFIVVGLPFMLLAATAPLLQIWYSATFATKQPYFLYAISNIGSFAALFGFLILIEPSWSTNFQLEIWSCIFTFFLLGIFMCGGYLFYKSPKKLINNSNKDISGVNIGNKIKWFLLAFIPASLLHGVTIYITNDLLALPVFWIVPLGLYLLTFVIAFTNIGQNICNFIRPYLLVFVFAPLLLLFWVDPLFNLTLLVLHVATFFLLSLICHGELYRSRPNPHDLGVFYLWISIGGACAGFFNVVISPAIFDTIFEYPLSIAMGVLVLLWFNYKQMSFGYGGLVKDIVCASLFALIVGIIYYNLPDIFIGEVRFQNVSIESINFRAVFLLLLLMIFIIGYLIIFRTRALNTGAFFIFLHLVIAGTTNHSLFAFANIDKFEKQKVVMIDRNFFGVIRVIDNFKDGLRVYFNGVGGHSAKGIGVIPSPYINQVDYRSIAIDYAHTQNLPTAVLGMGPARYQCYASPGQVIEYFEINPAVVSMAMDDDIFGYLKYCDGTYKVYIGDARLEISKQPDRKYGAIISTVYWSSTVPFHLFTKEALDTYISKIDEGGYFSIIIPEHFFDFAPLFAAYNAQSKYKFHMIQEAGNYFFKVFILRKEVGYNAPKNWEDISLDRNIPMWRDDFYNLLDVLKSPKNMRLTKDKKRFDML